MNPTLETLQAKLAELESVSGVSEHKIHSEIIGLRKDGDETEPCPEWIYEQLAFGFTEHYANNPSVWGTYFGPMVIWKTEDGGTVESPSISKVTAEAIEYWKQRTNESKNPLLQARYAGLVWDFSERVTGAAPGVEFAVYAITALIKFAEPGLHEYDTDTFGKLERALSIALSIGRSDLVGQSKDGIIRHERAVGVDEKAGLWGRCFDLLVANKKVSLSQAEEDAIINDLEGRLARLKDSDPWNCEHAAERLLRYYRSKNRSADVRRVVVTLGASFESAAEKAEPLVAMSWLEHIHQVYVQHGDKASSDRVAKMLRSIGPKVRDSMTPIAHTFEIKNEELEAYVAQYLQGSFEQALVLIAIKYAERKEKVHQQLTDLAKVAPLQFLCTKQITDADGRLVVTLGPLEEDTDGHIANQMSQNMSISTTFLHAVLEGVEKKFGLTTKQLLDHLYQSPVFSAGQKEFLRSAIDFYCDGQYVPAIHILIPQIEASIRNLLELTGGAVLKSGRSGGFQLKTLDEMLRSREVVDAFGEDIAFYFRVLLTDQRGWNVRNDVCHGLFSHEQMNKGVTDRLLHVLLLLALLRKKREPSE